MRYALMLTLAACSADTASINGDGGLEPDSAGSCNLVGTCEVGTPGVGGNFTGQWHVMVGSDCGPLMELDVCFRDNQTLVAIDPTCGIVEAGLVANTDLGVRLGRIDVPKCDGDAVRICRLSLAHATETPEQIIPGSEADTYGCDGCAGTATVISGSKTAVDCPDFPL